MEQSRKLTDADLELATQVMVNAFFLDPLWVYLFPNKNKRLKYLNHFFCCMIEISINNGQAYGVGVPLKGIAIWDMGANKVHGVDVFTLLKLTISPFAIYMMKAAPVFRSFAKMKKKYAAKPYWYLQSVGIDPSFQGQGYSKKLIQPILEQAEQKHINVYTETMTPTNVGLYRHYGFSVMEEQKTADQSHSIWSFFINNANTHA